MLSELHVSVDLPNGDCSFFFFHQINKNLQIMCSIIHSDTLKLPFILVTFMGHWHSFQLFRYKQITGTQYWSTVLLAPQLLFISVSVYMWSNARPLLKKSQYLKMTLFHHHTKGCFKRIRLPPTANVRLRKIWTRWHKWCYWASFND